MKVLVIDDDKIVVELVSAKLKKQGYEVLSASSGTEAFQIIEDNDIQLIITDVMMPTLNGIDFIRILKNRLFDNTPIIVISVLEDETTIYSALELGASDFMSKPINFEELIIRVNKLTRQVA